MQHNPLLELDGYERVAYYNFEPMTGLDDGGVEGCSAR